MRRPAQLPVGHYPVDGATSSARHRDRPSCLSDKYAIMDDEDVLLAALDGIRASGAPVHVEGADISDGACT